LAINIDVFVNDVLVTTLANNATFIYKLSKSGNVTLKSKGSGLLYRVTKPAEIIVSTENNQYYFINVGWDINVIMASMTYINQVSYSQVSKKFPQLANLVNQPNHGTPVNESTQTETSSKDIKILPVSAEQPIVKTQTNNRGTTNSVPILSDVDSNIPLNNISNSYRFALIIGNEDYNSYQNGLSSEVNVPFALNDAKIFKEYATKTLGIPQENILFLLNAKAIEMNRAVKKINLFAKNSNGKAEIFIYYAGHGFPDEISKEPYLIPVDVSGSDLQFAVKLKDLYASLTEFPALKITVFIDACFSGGARDQGLIAARGVKVKAKEEVIKGKMVVFTASSADQSSLSFKDKQHGMFTYFLLKKLQESKGNTSYKSLSDYLSEQVGLNSIRINDKEQNPQTIISSEINSIWGQWLLNGKK